MMKKKYPITSISSIWLFLLFCWLLSHQNIAQSSNFNNILINQDVFSNIIDQTHNFENSRTHKKRASVTNPNYGVTSSLKDGNESIFPGSVYSLGALMDTDGDNIDDANDLDDDNDGILDVDECILLKASNGDFSNSISGTPLVQSLGGGFDITITGTNIFTFTENTVNADEIYAAGTPISYVYPASPGTQEMTFSDSINVKFAITDLDQISEHSRLTVYDGNGVILPNPENYALTTMEGTSGTYPNGVSTTFTDLGTNINIDGAASTDYVDLYAIVDDNLNTFVRGNMLFFDFGDQFISKIIVENLGSGAPGFLFSEIKVICDTDDDGIPNYLDLDSDNDGCPDAIEGGGSFTTVHIQNDTLTGGVDGNGIPIVATASGQTIGYSQNDNIDACIDTDSDGIVDVDDLDNDNDGILDTNEGLVCTNTLPIDLSQITGEAQSGALSYTFPNRLSIDRMQDLMVTGGIFVNNSSSNLLLGSTNGHLRIGGNTNSPDYTTGDSYTINFSVPVFVQVAAQIVGSSTGSFDNDTFGGDELNLTATGGFTLSDAGGELLVQGTMANSIEIRPNQNFGSIQGTWEATTSQRVSSITIQGDGNPAFSIRLLVAEEFCTLQDTDGDDIEDYLDLDSDGDGCVDAIEGGGSFTTADIQNDTLTGGVDANGIPIVATASGQTISYSRNGTIDACIDTDSDGIANLDDLDNDNDGILDTDEQCGTSNQRFIVANQLRDGSLSNNVNVTGAWEMNNVSGGTLPNNAVYSHADAEITESASINNFPGADGVLNQSIAAGNVHQTGDPLLEVTDVSVEMHEFDQFSLNGSLTYTNVYDHLGNQLLTLSDIEFFDIMYSYTTPTADPSQLNITNPGSGTFVVTFVGGEHYTYYHFRAANGNFIQRFDVTSSGLNGPDQIRHTFYRTVQCNLDTDADNIANHLDLDSDNDGCPDAIEGGGSFTTADIQNDTLTGGVDANGVPILATASGQGIGDSQDAANFAACIDTDSDGIADVDDLDDDNDGILDTIECVLLKASNGDYMNSISGSPLVQSLGGGFDITFTGTNIFTLTENTVNANEIYAAGTPISYVYPEDPGTLEMTFSDSINVKFAITDLDQNSEHSRLTVYDENGVILPNPENYALTTMEGTSGTYPNGVSTTFTDLGTNINIDGAASPDYVDLYSIVNNNLNTFVRGNMLFFDFGDQLISKIIVENLGSGAPGFLFSEIKVICDTDDDGIPNYLDLDSDNDGCSDAIEGGGSFTTSDIDVNDRLTGGVDAVGIPIVATASGQTIGDSQDNAVQDADCIDTDGDGIFDAVDIDDDNDGIPDDVEAATAINGGDTDGDGIPDIIDLDSDNDGIPDLIEAGGTDTDGDGIVDDACNVSATCDTDGDGLMNSVDEVDDTSNPSPTIGIGGTLLPVPDIDSDGHPDFQDLDADNDGINDIEEAGIADTDNNGIIDQVNPDGTLSNDPDMDGFGGSLDPDDGGTSGITTDPDANNDGQPDDDDADGTPYNADDTDSDGTPDFQDLDSDNDGINDVIEGGNGALDTDGNGTIDSGDTGFADTDMDGIPDPIDENPTIYGDAGNRAPTDTDSDNIPDYQDLDSDNDSINDTEEAGLSDPNGDGLVDNPTVDTDGDGIPDSVDGVPGTFGDEPGAGDDPTDTDMDGNPDFQELDSDNDGTNDIDENGQPNLDANNDGEVDDTTDLDGDGIVGTADLDPNNFGDLPDSDGDGDPDATDPDDNDACAYSASQVFANASAAWLAADCDGDGVTNQAEIDPDGNGMDEGNGTDPQDACSLTIANVSLLATSTSDCDGDGVTNADEINGLDGAVGGGDNTDPTDACSMNLSQVTLLATSTTDCDGDGVTNADEINSTGGGDPQTDPNDSCSYNAAEQGTPSATWNMADCDGDGNPNGPDPDPLNANAVDDSGSAPIGQTTAIDILGNDDFLDNNDGANLGTTTITNVGTGTAGGTIAFDPSTGELNYTPLAGESSMTVTVVYQVCNDASGGSICDQAIVTITVPNGTDTDGDGVPDMTDIDDDNDGIPDDVEAATAINGGDTDGDGLPDIIDLDSDNDGIPDLIEAGGTDTDGDGIVDDACNVSATCDTDGDGLMNSVDEVDDTANPNPTTGIAGTLLPIPDTDSDGHPDFQDLDADNDGINDIEEAGIADTDNNGIIDQVNPDGTLSNDPDMDGFGGSLDPDDGGTSGITTDPDANNDGQPDDDDVDGTPYNADDTDSDGTPDFQDLDSDNDSINDVIEGGNGDLDTDGDGTIDSGDTGFADIDMDGIPDPIDENPTIYGDAGNSAPTDTDSDNIPDYQDLDSDNDSINDTEEAGLSDPNGDGLVDNPTVDTDGDGIPDSVDGVPNAFGDEPGTSDNPTDTDADGNPDFQELDSDNNGTDDIDESGQPSLDSNNNGEVDDTSDPDGDGIVGGADLDPNNFGDAPAVSGPLALNLKVFLQGAFTFGGTSMYDSLRSQGLIPLAEPYTAKSTFSHVGVGGGETIASSVLMATGNDAIVDWVFVELRSATDETQVITTRAALVQRDGDVVDVDGVSMLTFSATVPDNYYVAVRHRNHLGAMTTIPYALSTTPTLVDFTTLADSGTYGMHAQKDLLGDGSLWGLWTGNSTVDKFEIFQGINNDPNTIFFDVTFAANNTDFLANYINRPVYADADVNMDGQVIFQGPDNEPNYIFFNVLSYPANTNFISNYIMQEQLP